VQESYKLPIVGFDSHLSYMTVQVIPGGYHPDSTSNTIQIGSYAKHKRTTVEKLDKDGRVVERTITDEWEYPQQSWPNPYQPVWQDPAPYKVWCSDNTAGISQGYWDDEIAEN
jgi:hypothetical protein